MLLRVLSVLLVGLLSIVSAEPGLKTPKTLVLLDGTALRNSHSMFFESLQARGHQLEFRDVYEEDEVQLNVYGEWQYDNMVLFAPSADGFGRGISVDAIIEFVDSGRNLLVAANENATDPIREIANECGVDFDETETAVIDHHRFDTTEGELYHTVIVADGFVEGSVIVPSAPKAPVVFKGIGQNANENPLISKVLVGNPTTLSHVPTQVVTAYPQSTGVDTLLVTAVQTRNNARVLFSGSLDMFSNQFFTMAVSTPDGKRWPKSGNEEFAAVTTRWLFGESGVLRTRDLVHRKAGGDQQKSYRVKDDIEFGVTIEEWSGLLQKWVPFMREDVYLELVMLDPHIRVRLSVDKATGRYTTAFRLPDVYGVFKFSIVYSKHAYSNLKLHEQVSVHPFRHSEFERFIPVAYPYYVAALVMMAGFFVFGAVFMLHAAPKAKAE